MLICPSCNHRNETGTLFCERCKSDLAQLSEKLVMSENVQSVLHDSIPMAEASAPPGVMEGPESNPPGTKTDRVAIKPAEGTFDIPQLPKEAQPKLVVIRGLKLNVEFGLFDGDNYIGRTDEKPVDIDLEDQESPDRIWSSRQHARVIMTDGRLVIEDLGSQNGTFVNRTRVFAGQRRPLGVGDVIQIGTVQLRVCV